VHEANLKSRVCDLQVDRDEGHPRHCIGGDDPEKDADDVDDAFACHQEPRRHHHVHHHHHEPHRGEARDVELDLGNEDLHHVDRDDHHSHHLNSKNSSDVQR